MSHRRWLGEVFPLPGVGELESIVKGLINLAKTAGYEKQEVKLLSGRLTGLSSIASAGRNCDAVTQLSSRLQDIKTRFEGELTRKSRSLILKAEERRRAIDMLHRELDHLIEETQLRLRVANTPSTAEVRFKPIDACDIVFDDTESPTWVVQPQVPTLRPSTLVTNCRLGRLGKLRIAYTTFASQSNHLEEIERVEEVLKYLSHAQHPNLAAIVGITKGYHGPTGFVVTMEGAPIRKLFERSVAGGVLACCIKGLAQAMAFLNSRKGLGGVDWDGAGVTVAANGHVTALPSNNPTRTEMFTYQWATDCVITMTLHIYCQAVAFYRRGHYVWTKCIPRFLERLTSLGRAHLTELQLLKISADSKLDPLQSNHCWLGTTAPPFTLHAGDLVCAVETKRGKEVWGVVDECSDSNDEKRAFSDYACLGRCKWEKLPSSHPHYLTWVTNCPHQSVHGPDHDSEKTTQWEHIMRRASRVSKQLDIKMDGISYVFYLWFLARVDRFPMSRSNDRLYYHRNPFSRSSPRDFWGFFSTSSDPYAPSTGMEDFGWTIEYQLDFNTLCIGDDWGRQYRRQIQAGLGSIPGGYPGAHIEELSEDEAE
ncbi:hypothetical protein BDV93DRAFT_529192 [Ceratobasidium sp. AG-I]|nr:hypothetical protein BDV93DRAFT_529192 [Ceratobasidium sp. AG-I]